ncbi:HNH endonuclease signature motif containing protein [Photobacterium sp. GB-56]|uniref:HNH endonuclease signature motif containing protein n=1 Tax=Photobacterium sp. GB-56 TaxID=2022106 RepID=UPI00351A0197
MPSQIADKLRGREFSSFDTFRKAFWLAVSEDMELLKGFSRSNQRLIKRGNAPFCVEDDTAGGRERFEIHHIKEIQYGGKVYDVDNLSVVTPKRHIDIHKGL